MNREALVERLAGLAPLASIPRDELEWLVAHGEVAAFEPGTAIMYKGGPLDRMFVVLSGYLPIYRDLGTGPRLVMTPGPGDVSGLLPYSRGVTSPTDVYLVEATEVLAIRAEHLPQFVQRCPAFTTYVVHLMLDRARLYDAAGLQEERAFSLGKLAAGLAHELNNPASAAVRSAKLLSTGLRDADAAVRELTRSGLTSDELDAVERLRDACIVAPVHAQRSPIQQARHEQEIGAWLERHGADPAHAAPLAETAVGTAALDELARRLSGDRLDAALAWVAARCAIHSLAADIGASATQIYELVNALKRFTHMDRLSGAEIVDVGQGLGDTLKVIESKRQAKGAVLSLDLQPELPKVRAAGGDLNQIWLSLIDNALDAIPQGGHVHISARRELDRVVVRVADDGTGIPPDILPRIFDPFFTTKAPGQGTGLGLDIARKLLMRHDGDVSVQSRPGRTEFVVRLRAYDARQAGSG